MRLRATAAASILAVGFTSIARAEEPVLPAALQEGSRVRLLAPSIIAGPLTGTVVLDGEDFVIVDMPEQVRVRVPRSAILRAELSSGRRRHGGVGFLIGAAALGGLFAATGRIVEGCPAEDSSCYASRQEAFAVGAIIGGLTGAYIGQRMVSESWHPIALDGVRLSIGVAPGAGPRAALSFSF